MALKFLNKKGWHTGSLRNIENVWKAEQKHEAEQKKLEELRKQIHEERERAEFRQLQVEAGLIPRQERLDFLYESGLAVGKGASSFKALESVPKNEPEAAASSSAAAKQQSGVPGALFDEKPATANDSWRKLHSDPLLMIRQKEQEALARVKNNPIQMAMIRKSVEVKNGKDKDEKKHRKKHRKKKSKHQKHSSSENDSDSEDPSLTVDKHRDDRHKGSKSDKSKRKISRDSDGELSEGDSPRKKYYEKEYKHRRPISPPNSKYDESDREHQSKKRSHDSQRREYSSEHQVASHGAKRNRYNSSDKPPRNEPSNRHYDSQSREYSSERGADSRDDKRCHLNPSERPRKDEPNNRHYDSQRKEYSPEHSRDDRRSHFNSSDKPPRNEPSKRHQSSGKISEEERAARLREMQMDAERHEEQRWKRLKKAADSDAAEAVHDHANLGRNFLDATQKSVYGAEKGGSSTIEESVRRRTHYLQRRSNGDSNAFRRS